MTDTPDLNIAGSPIYEQIVATSGDPYQPPAYQLPDLYGAAQADGSAVAGRDLARGWDSGSWDAPAAAAAGPGTPAALSQFLGRMLDGQSWVAVLVFGGPMAEQLRHQYQQFQQFQQFQQAAPPAGYGAAAQPGYGNVPGYAGQPGGPGASEWAAMQAYQQAYMWAQQQAALAAAPPSPPALTAGPEPAAVPAAYPAPPALPAAEDTQAYGGMLTQDWAGWLGRTSQNVRPQEVEEDPIERRGGGLAGRLGAAMRELRGR